MDSVQVKERLEEKRNAINLALEALDAVVEEGAPEGGEAPGTVAEIAKAVLSEEAGPIRTKPLAARILARGFRTRSKDFYPVVYKAMRTHGEFERTPQGWMLKAS